MSYEKTLSYPTDKYPFQELMKKVLQHEGDLRKAHTLIQESNSWDQITFQNEMEDSAGQS